MLGRSLISKIGFRDTISGDRLIAKCALDATALCQYRFLNRRTCFPTVASLYFEQLRQQANQLIIHSACRLIESEQAPICSTRRGSTSSASHRRSANLERDMSLSAPATSEAGNPGEPARRRRAMPALALAALGIVYGDIGTSPLYTLQTVFDPTNGLTLNALNVVGIVSLIVWSLTVVVSLKYVALILRANNHGEGGIMALLALAASSVTTRPRLRRTLLGVGIMGAALFYGDSVITPAISVLSAVEGLEVAAPFLKTCVIPVTLIALVTLFLMQKRGTAGIGKIFGPVMVLWFIVLAVVGVINMMRAPAILVALDPFTGLAFCLHHRWLAFVALGAV